MSNNVSALSIERVVYWECAYWLYIVLLVPLPFRRILHNYVKLFQIQYMIWFSLRDWYVWFLLL